jgi:alanyl-tRNA synthetase
MKSIEIRQKFFDFFVKKGHEKVASSSLIPAQDPTLLFTNAGMNQFKDVFLGLEKRSYKRAVSIQKCMRAGGKHNDLDNVGFTKRHLTFFEMMGNFSFGDYFKKEAIAYAWEFLVKDLKMDTKNLYATVYEKDDESYDIWHKEIGLPKDKIYKLGTSDNFWQMGDTGPCGPCTEIYIDRGEAFGCGKDSCSPGCNCDRFLEFWNNVFMQYDRQSNGDLVPLKQTGVDTGMGLERLCAILQDKDSVFEIDLFEPILKKIEELTKIQYKQQDERTKAAFHVLADHIRASCFVIADGCSPSNEGRGYVLRKIIRRAALFEQKLSEVSIFPDLASSVIDSMGSIYPELKVNEQIIKSILKSEIDKFSHNLIRGKHILEQYFEESKNKKIITGQQAFKLYDTFGFPVEIVDAAAKERGYSVDFADYEKEMNKQRALSGKKEEKEEIEIDESITTEFTGYNEFETESEIIAIIRDHSNVEKVSSNETCWIITKKTPFFVETGGQVNDKGFILSKGQKAEILDLKKIGKAIGIQIKAPNELKIGDKITQSVDQVTRINTMKNHTATHLLQAALIQLLGKQVKQSGSVVTPDYLRFDFTYHRNLTPEEIRKVEEIVNQKITENIPLNIFTTTYKDAISKGVIAIFGEKYNPENVRVIDMSPFSAELCGGTHVRRTGDIGCFKIIEIGALSAGNRRIVALTGPKAIELFQETFNTVKQLSQEFKVKPEQVFDSVIKQKEQIKDLQTKISKLKKQSWQSKMHNWIQEIEEINGLPFLFLGVEDYDNADIKEIATELSAKKPGLYFVISNIDNSSIFIGSLSDEYKNKISIKEFSHWLKTECNLHGGGKDNIIQGGGAKFDKSLKDKIIRWLKSK